MTQEQFDEWIAALEDPETKKGKYALKRTSGEMCCLGVLACLHKVPHTKTGIRSTYAFEFDKETSVTAPDIGWMGLDSSLLTSLINLNDNNDTFTPVVRYLKDHKDKIVEKSNGE